MGFLPTSTPPSELIARARRDGASGEPSPTPAGGGGCAPGLAAELAAVRHELAMTKQLLQDERERRDFAEAEARKARSGHLGGGPGGELWATSRAS